MTTKKLIIAIAMIVVVISMLHSCSASITFIETSEVTDILGSPTDDLEDSPLTDTSTSSVRLTLIPRGILMFEGNSTLTLHTGMDYSEASDTPTGATGDMYIYIYIYIHSLSIDTIEKHALNNLICACIYVCISNESVFHLSKRVFVFFSSQIVSLIIPP